MKKDIFRKKSLDRIQSPEQIDEYVRVVTPGFRLSVGAVILLLATGIMWAVMARIEVSVVQPDGQVKTEEIAPISFIFDEGK